MNLEDLRQASCDHSVVSIAIPSWRGNTWRRSYCERCQYVFRVGSVCVGCDGSSGCDHCGADAR